MKLEGGKQEEKPGNITNGAQESGTINATSLRVRSQANTSSAILGSLKNGEKVTILGKQMDGRRLITKEEKGTSR
ncbi:SH3 domain-containing protein [Bacillus arachidis]|uniref:SH3 domain-containing protein n=1 Tax=Bacillus arachidis TaxID=2819290 RepID=UPI00255C9A08|nr:SH3 domain-containing protein [Bacillus arachidis]WIY61726.1 SH3 domain-containing protein [Bacillus arachidis]